MKRIKESRLPTLEEIMARAQPVSCSTCGGVSQAEAGDSVALTIDVGVRGDMVLMIEYDCPFCAESGWAHTRLSRAVYQHEFRLPLGKA